MTRWTLPPDKIPTAWFNVAPHLASPPMPPLHPGTREPVGPDDLAPLFPMALIGQEVSAEPWIDEPDHPGSLGSAISDAVRDCVGRPDTHYALGSVLNHVLLHQTVIGLEAKEQLQMAGERLPDVVIAPCGGGSNLGGISFPFVPD